MAKLAITQNPTIVKNGGPITSDVYKSHATELWTKGTLLKLHTDGLLEPCSDSSSASVEIDTADTGTAAAHLFIAIEDHLTAGSVFVAVQKITTDTIIELQLLNAGAGGAKTSDVVLGGKHAGYQIDTGAHQGSGLWGLDVDDVTNPILTIIDVQSNYNPHDPKAVADYGKVLVKFLPAILA
jgi:hypothetical protein